jgi:hypothetical protein
MAPKHPYTDEASKGAFLIFPKNGESIPAAAKKAKVNIKTARNIKNAPIRSLSIATSTACLLLLSTTE